jgi:hypothetical protein
LTNDFFLWSQFHDIFLLFRVSLLLSNFSTDINTQERSDLLPDLVLSSSEANGHLLETYGKMFIPDASTLSNGWTNNGHSLYYSRDVGQHADVVHRVLGAPAPAADAAGGKKRDASEASLIADPNTEAAKKVQRQGRLHCSFHLAGKLGVKDSNNAQMSCSAGEGCPYQHTTQLTALTKSTGMTCTRFKSSDKPMQERFKAAVTAYSGFKTAGAPPNPPGSKKRKALGVVSPA